MKKVSEQDPTDHKVIWQIAEIYFVAGDTQTAELLIEKAIDLKNDNPKYYLTMVEIYYNTERYDEALAYMEKIIKLRPTNPKYLLATAELYEQI
ncbi:tetratricopeptide repeat protein [bacterium]|nr:tetratricopeptide repeat protein [bacterium]MBR4567229.1 tetratricopeptide repeat protein [bacterium]